MRSERGRGAMAPMVASGVVSAAFSVATIGRTPSGGYLATLLDDAMISMTYARNLADGHGLVWNAGEAPVEGYSNFLWTVVMAVFSTLGFDDRFAAVPVMFAGTALLAVTVWLVHRITLALNPDADDQRARVAAWIVALLYPLSFWTLRGMEVGLVAALVCAAVLVALRYERRPTDRHLWALSALGAALALTRDDALVPALLVLAYLAIRCRASWRVIAVSLLGVVVAVAAHTAFRLAAYGEALPNTYYLKVAGVSLGSRVGRGVESLFRLGMVSTAALALVAVPGLRRVGFRRSQLLWVLVSTAVVYSVAVGGDAWERMPYANRYVTAVLPLLAPFAAVTIVATRWRVAASYVLALTLAAPFYAAATDGIQQLDQDRLWAREGIAVRAATEPGTSIAVVAAGNVPFFARRPSIDLLGKNDRVIAHGPHVAPFHPGHSKYDLRYSISTYRPSLVLHVRTDGSNADLLRGLGYRAAGRIWYRPDEVTASVAASVGASGAAGSALEPPS